MLARLIAAAVAVVSVPASPSPALYVASDSDTTIYLFGTIHALGDGGWFEGDVRAAFERSDELVVETLLPERGDPPPTLRRADAALHALLGREDRAKLRGIAGTRFDRFRPWVAWTVLQGEAISRAGYAAELGADAVLVRAARARGMPIVGLETVEQQIAILESLPDADQIELLRRALHEPEADVRTLRAAIEDWRAGDTEAAAAAFNGVYSPEAHDRLNSSRNIDWAEWIEERLTTPGVVFVAVGVAHLGGPGSVQDQLAQRGIAVRRERPASTRAVNLPPR